jgi:hypothetical protein
MALMITASYAYVTLGAVIAVGFVLVGVDRIDPAARGAWLARLMWLPGLVLLWPVVVIRWIALERQRGQTR